jgi:hypothetical protein
MGFIDRLRSLDDYDVGYTDLKQSLSVAEAKVIAARKA